MGRLAVENTRGFSARAIAVVKPRSGRESAAAYASADLLAEKRGFKVYSSVVLSAGD